MATEKPILFSTPMVQAILDGRKTQTRRTKGLKEVNFAPELWNYNGFNEHQGLHVFQDPVGTLVFVKSPYGKPGDLLWVRETFLKLDPDHMITSNYAYKANGDSNTEELRKDYIKQGRNYKWKPSIHMPKEAARIWLRVQDVRVERLQDISELEAISEGIELVGDPEFPAYKNYMHGEPDHYKRNHFLPECDYSFNHGKESQSGSVASFCTLWLSINGPESWQANPWVWVVVYEVVSTTGKEAING